MNAVWLLGNKLVWYLQSVYVVLISYWQGFGVGTLPYACDKEPAVLNTVSRPAQVMAVLSRSVSVNVSLTFPAEDKS